MNLSIEYLCHRHVYWKERIGACGIWNPELFQPVEIIIRKECRSYHGMFQRRIKTKDGKKETRDRIIIYNKKENFDQVFLDSVLVHEMVHQYILQNNLKDLRSHGPLFRGFMKRINESFIGELKLKIKDTNPHVPLKGAGETIHQILALRYNDGNYFLAIIHPGKKEFFEKMIKKYKRIWNLKDYIWAESNDLHFNRYRRCMRSLHGIKKTKEEFAEWCREYNVKFSK